MAGTRSLLERASEQLAAAGLDSPRVDAEALLAHCLGTTRSRLPVIDTVDRAAADAFRGLVARRARREPLQYLVGTAAFRRVVVGVGPGVFIPRPETELLLDAVLPALSARALPGPPVVVDLCAGSVALGLAARDEVPGARVWAVENSPAALEWLSRNTAGTGVQVRAGDVADPGLLAELSGRVDAVLSNPPYVPEGSAVAAEVHADPPQAVFAGPDGLQVIPHVLARAAEMLRPGGVVAVEHHESHATRVPSLLAEDGRWTQITAHADLTGRPRYALARRR